MPKPKATILAVDDSEDILGLIEVTLGREHRVKLAQDGPTALRLAFEEPRPDLILLDVEMPEAGGYEICKTLKASPAVADVPVIFLSGHSESRDVVQGFQLGAIDYLSKPIIPPVLAARVRIHLELIARRHQQDELIRERTTQLEQTRLQLIRRLGRVMEYHETSAVGNRVVRLGHYARALAQAAGARPAICDLMMKAAPLHDIGKVGVPAQLLRKAGSLSEPEREQMRRHPEIGAEIIGEHDDPLLKLARTLALTHHERWDGSGYPAGARGVDIPWAGRVMAIVDAFESMTTTQFHRGPMPVELAANEIVSAAGKQFDPAMVEAFRKALPEFRHVLQTYGDQLGDMLNLDFASKPSAAAAVPAPAPQDKAEIEARSAQGVRDADAARAKALAEAQARLQVERDLAAAASRDIVTQQASLKRAEEESAREAELLRAARQRTAEEAAAARLTQERVAAEEKAEQVALEAQAAHEQARLGAQEKAAADDALAAAAARRRQAEESLARTAQERAAAEASAAEAARARAAEESAAAEAAQARREAAAQAAEAARKATAGNEALSEAVAARAAAEAALAEAERRLAGEEKAEQVALEAQAGHEQARFGDEEKAAADEALAAAAARRRLAEESLARFAQERAAAAERAADAARARAAEESAAAQAAQARRQAAASAAEAARQMEASHAALREAAEKRAAEDAALVDAALEKQSAEEAAATSAAAAASANEQAAQAAGRRAAAEAAARSAAEARAQAESSARRSARKLEMTNALAASAASEAVDVEPAPVLVRRPARVVHVYLAIALALATGALGFFEQPSQPPRIEVAVAPIRPMHVAMAEPPPLLDSAHGDALALRLDGRFERISAEAARREGGVRAR
ncbi:MAG TPA: HD domain-containing phosphohydrolase [Burkholderiales bacterium]|nr:HD domain-containing phosphohydrolase [Burkholderiales bacterium]